MDDDFDAMERSINASDFESAREEGPTDDEIAQGLVRLVRTAQTEAAAIAVMKSFMAGIRYGRASAAIKPRSPDTGTS